MTIIESGGKKFDVGIENKQPIGIYRHQETPEARAKAQQLKREQERGKKVLNGNNR
ncbi:MAG TPA: hypothetical protein PK639_00200 [Candidatus Woesebacteria bacterium]|nr:hypothetical protein [Candidatus Woesebacteria bacterium]